MNAWSLEINLVHSGTLVWSEVEFCVKLDYVASSFASFKVFQGYLPLKLAIF